jgi:hypothetical protein
VKSKSSVFRILPTTSAIGLSSLLAVFSGVELL